MPPRARTEIIIAALEVLAKNDNSECGTEGAALMEAAERLEEFQTLIRLVDKLLKRVPLLSSHDQRIHVLVSNLAE
jgi:hypothetical protein